MIHNRQPGHAIEPLDLFAQRDAILAKHQSRELARWLEAECYHRWLEGDEEGHVGLPQSANDARKVLAAHGFEGIDTNFLAGVFLPKHWGEVGRVPSASPDGHARKINTYRPRPGVVLPRLERPRWP